jgi:ceramide glucosyltransferase
MSASQILLHILDGLALIPVAGGSVFSVLCVWAAFRVVAASRRPVPIFTPPVSVLKPIYGLDRELEENLRSFCDQDYPDFEIVLSLQRENDPARPLLERLQADYPDRVKLTIRNSEPVLNGKVQNLMIGLDAARHDVLVISDSDTRVPRDYLKAIVAPLADPKIGYVCTLYRIAEGRNLAEKLELLSMNCDFGPSLIFTYWTNAAVFCLGASTALRRADLDAIGGLASLADYLVEDQEMGRRLTAAGKPMRFVPMTIDMIPDYADLKAWWRHVVYWDQNTRAANPSGFAATILIRAVPFACLFAILAGFSGVGLGVLAAALGIRIATAAAIAAILRDRGALDALWLLPFRDLIGLASWAAALRKRSFTWRGHEFRLTREGRIVPRET